MKSTAFTDCFVVSAAALAAIFLSGANVQAKSGDCSPTKTHFVTGDTTAHFTSSKTYVNMPGTTARFTQGGNKASCVIVTLSMVASATANDEMIVKGELLSGAEVSPPETPVAQSPSSVEHRTIVFVFPSVKPGKQELKFHFRSFAGNPVVFQYPNVLVQYAP